MAKRRDAGATRLQSPEDLAFAVFAFSGQPNTQQIVKLSIAATEADWKAIPHFSDIERDVDTKGGSTTSKTYKVLMIDGSPYSRLIAVDDKPLSPAEGAQESEKLRDVIANRARESPKQRAKRLAQYEKDRNRMFALMHAMAGAFNIRVIYSLEAIARQTCQTAGAANIAF